MLLNIYQYELILHAMSVPHPSLFKPTSRIKTCYVYLLPVTGNVSVCLCYVIKYIALNPIHVEFYLHN